VNPVVCDVVDRCGGCPWLAKSSDAERNYKLTLLQTVCTAVSPNDVSLHFRTATQRVGYRNRIRLRIDEHGSISFFNSEKSPQCAVLEPSLKQFVNRLREWSRARGVYLGHFAHLEARSPDHDGLAGLFLTFRADVARADADTRLLCAELGPVLVATDRDPDVPYQHLAHAGGTWLNAPLDGFVQINTAANHLLVNAVVHGALAEGCRSFADLFGGAGNFALPLARAGLSGWLVESHPGCVRAAQAATQQQNLTELQCQTGDAIATARQRVSNQECFDVVIVDPPRAGIRDGHEVVSRLARRAIAYCSCNLQTLERDLQALLKLGWSLRHLTGFDMFPGTRHIEALAWLVPTSPGSRA
jgi:23S rRNA (uracil1939-C5)-methyltransferase